MTNTTTKTELTYYVSSESESYGQDCTTEQASIIADYIADKMVEYAEQQGYDATIEIRAHVGGERGKAWDEDGEAALEDMASYDESNWTDWAGEALNGQ